MAGLVPAIDVLPAVIGQAFDCASLRGAAEPTGPRELGPMTNSAESECDSVGDREHEACARMPTVRWDFA